MSKRFPIDCTHWVNSNSGGGIFFYPTLKLSSFNDLTSKDDPRSFRYGVVSQEHAIGDLRHWDTFAVASRFIRPFTSLHLGNTGAIDAA